MCGVCAPAGACPGVAGSAGVSGTRRGACLLCRLPTLPLWCPRGGVPALSPVNPALTCFPAPLPRRGRIDPRPPSPAGKGGTKGYFMQGAPPLASPGLNPGGTCSPCRWGTRRVLNPGGTCSTCPGGEDHLKRRSSSPPVPLSLAAGTAHQCRVPTATPPVGTVNARRADNAGGKPPAGYHDGRLCKCRRRFNAGVPGAKPPAK